MDNEDAWAILPIYLAAGALCRIAIIAGAIAVIRGMNTNDGW